MLKNATPDFFCQEPELGDEFGSEMHEDLVTATLTKPFDQPVEITLLVVSQPHLDCYLLTHDAVEANLVLRFSQEVDMEIEELRNGFVASKARQEQGVFAKWRRNCQRPMCLCVL